MRPIDAEPLYDKAETWYKNAPTPFRLIYRSFVYAIADAPTIAPPPNDPLTMAELREMDGEPVWVVFTPDTDGERLAIWALVSVDKENDEIFLSNSIGGSSAYEEVWADIEAIYRRKPKEG